MRRWSFTTEGGGETYTFEINPNAQGNPLPSREMTWDSHPTLGWSGKRAPRAPLPWEFSGVLRSKAQYDALLRWVGKRVKIVVTDDRGERLTVRLLSFEPAQEAGTRHRSAPYRMQYTMRALIFTPRTSLLSPRVIVGQATVKVDSTPLRPLVSTSDGQAAAAAALTAFRYQALLADAVGQATTRGALL